MRGWTALALLVCLLVGYLFGSVSRDQGPDRAIRRQTAEAHAEPAPPETLATHAPEGVASPASAPPDLPVFAPDPALPSEDGESEYGTLIVDFEGFDGPKYVRVEAVDLEGNRDFLEEGADEEGKSPIQLAPGEVTVRWESHGGMQRYAARARIEAGRVTLVRAADERHVPLPETPGLAVLDVRLSDPDGRSLADATVSVGGTVLEGTRWLTVCTDGEGRARFRVRSGSYVIHVGGRWDTVSLAAGERRTLELLHDAFGMVVIDPVLEGTYALHLSDRNEASLEVDYMGGTARFFFVPPGNYGLWYHFASPEFVMFPGMGTDRGTAGPGRRLLTTVEVRPGRAERIPHSPEPGFLEVEVPAPRPASGQRWQLRVSRQGDQGSAVAYPLESDGSALRGRAGPLTKGAYLVEILADGEVVAGRSAVVGYGPTPIDAVTPR